MTTARASVTCTPVASRARAIELAAVAEVALHKIAEDVSAFHVISPQDYMTEELRRP